MRVVSLFSSPQQMHRQSYCTSLSLGVWDGKSVTDGVLSFVFKKTVCKPL